MNAPEIIYSDKNFIIVNKPAGLAVHGGGSVTGKTLVDFLTEKFPEIKNVGDPLISPHTKKFGVGASSGNINFRPGIVHRLDKDTSGIMLVAGNQKIFEELKKLFQERKIEKKYLTLVCGSISQKSGVISSPIGRLIKNPTKRGTGTGIKSEREAITSFKTLKRYALSIAGSDGVPFLANYSLLEVTPKTGRMHQIRVHLKSIGHPIACDKIYGGKNVCCPQGLSRMFLHAQSLEFSMPEGKKWRFEADLPEDLENALKKIGNLAKN